MVESEEKIEVPKILKEQKLMIRSLNINADLLIGKIRDIKQRVKNNEIDVTQILINKIVSYSTELDKEIFTTDNE